MKKKIGIWLDKRQAVLVSLQESGEQIRMVASNLDFAHPKGGSRSKTRWGPQDVIKEKSFMEKEKNQLRDYFHQLAKAVKKADKIAIYGPGSTAAKFRETLQRDFPTIADAIDHMGRADSMTKKQFAALVRNHFAPATSY